MRRRSARPRKRRRARRRSGRQQEDAARADAQRKDEAARLAAASAAAQKKSQEDAARAEAQRKAQEDAARAEAQRKDEAARLAAANAAAQKKSQEDAARAEAQRKAQEETARTEAERRAPAGATVVAQADTPKPAMREASDARPVPSSAGAEVSARRKTVMLVGFSPDKSRVFVRTSEPVRYTVSQADDRTVVLELENTTIQRSNDCRLLDTRFFGGPVVNLAPSSQWQDRARRRHLAGQSGVSSPAGRQRGLVAVRALSRSGRPTPRDDPARPRSRPAGPGFGDATPGGGRARRYQAEEGTSDGHGNVIHLKGKAELRTDTARIQADQIDYDQRTRIVTAAGHCYAVNGLAGAVADGLTLDLDGNWLQLQNGRLFVKADVAPEVLLQTSTPEQLVATGRTTLAARVERAERVGQGHLKINGLDFTPCDCNPLEPHWSIKAIAADVHPGDQAWLWLPVIYVYGVPILPLPVLDVPLKPQKTGLLVTTPSHSAQNGWQVTQPVYFALASNWDLTASPGYTWGSSAEPLAGVQTLGVKGPSLDTEVRWAHSRDTKGDIELFLLDDLRTLRDPRSLGFYPATLTTPGGSSDVLDEKRGFREV